MPTPSCPPSLPFRRPTAVPSQPSTSPSSMTSCTRMSLWPSASASVPTTPACSRCSCTRTPTSTRTRCVFVQVCACGRSCACVLCVCAHVSICSCAFHPVCAGMCRYFRTLSPPPLPPWAVQIALLPSLIVAPCRLYRRLCQSGKRWLSWPACCLCMLPCCYIVAIPGPTYHCETTIVV